MYSPFRAYYHSKLGYSKLNPLSIYSGYAMTSTRIMDVVVHTDVMHNRLSLLVSSL